MSFKAPKAKVLIDACEVCNSRDVVATYWRTLYPTMSSGSPDTSKAPKGHEYQCSACGALIKVEAQRV